MDEAFERRFLYKIEFHNPDESTRREIWHSLRPELSNNDLSVLAGNYRLSGGQIENVVRKAAIDSVLYGKTPSAEIFRRYCQRELQYKSKGTIIGF
jgi:SpoVK/Ycf46/Vps4 family AAA+-type ATPase